MLRPPTSSIREADSVTMKDIANALGISVATVSLALSDRPTVAQATRVQVWEKARELGYRKNPMVAALMRSRRSHRTLECSPVLAYLNLFPDRYGYKTSLMPDYYPSAAKEAVRLGFRLERFWACDPACDMPRLSDMLYARGIGGILLGPCPTEQLPMDFDWDRFCWTSLTLAPDMPSVDHVCSDHFSIMTETMHRAMNMGCRRIALAMRHSSVQGVAHAWLGAYLAEMHEYFPKQALLEPFVENQWTVPALRKWLQKVAPDAVIGVIDAPRLTVLREAAPAVPEKLNIFSVVVKNDTPGLTGMQENISAVAALAVRHLVFLLQGNETGIPSIPRYIRLPGLWNSGTTAVAR